MQLGQSRGRLDKLIPVLVHHEKHHFRYSDVVRQKPGGVDVKIDAIALFEGPVLVLGLQVFDEGNEVGRQVPSQFVLYLLFLDSLLSFRINRLQHSLLIVIECIHVIIINYADKKKTKKNWRSENPKDKA